MKRAQRQQPSGIFPGGLPDLGTFDAMIHRIPHQVGQRILDGLDQRLVEFGLLALHLDPHLLAAVQRQIAHRARKLAPDIADRLHSGLHDAFLQFGRDQVEPLAGGQQAALFACCWRIAESDCAPAPVPRPGSSTGRAGSTSSRMVLSLALCPRAACCARCASATSAGRAAPWSTRISPMWRGSSGFASAVSRPHRISAGHGVTRRAPS